MDNRFRLSIIDSTPAYVEELGEYEDCIASKGEEEFEITIVETKDVYYINLNTGLGWGSYDKGEWTLFRAAKHQCFDMFDN